MLHGKGVSLESYDLSTFQAHERSLLAWPPGYSYAVAGVCKVTGLSVYQSSWAVDVLAMAALWCVLLWFTFLLRFTLLQTTVLFLLAGFCHTPWVYLWSADTLGSVLFLFSAALNVYFIQRDPGKRNSAWFVLLQFLLIGAMCFLKYSLLPAYLSLALSIFSFSWKGKKKNFIPGLFLIGAIIISLALLFLYNKNLSGHTNEMGNLYQQQKGLFFSNLLMYDPFLLKSLIYFEGILQRLQSYRAESFIRLLNISLVLLTIAHIGRRMLGGRADYFSHLVFWTVVAVCTFLSVLSLFYQQQKFIGTYAWTYVKEFRYFTPVTFLLTLYLIRNFHFRMPRTVFSGFAFVFIGFAAVFGLGLSGYYKFTHNKAGSFENMVGHVTGANKFVHEKQDSNTYFVSMTGNSGIDAQVTSLAAISGSKVVISYDGAFPDSYVSPLFSKDQPLRQGKKVIVYVSENQKILDSLNPRLPHSIEQDEKGDTFLLVNP